MVDIDQGDRRASPLADVLVASVPTLGRAVSNRLDLYDPARFKCIIVDEVRFAPFGTRSSWSTGPNHLVFLSLGARRRTMCRPRPTCVRWTTLAPGGRYAAVYTQARANCVESKLRYTLEQNMPSV